MKQETRPDVHMEKQLGWARKLGGAVCGDLQGGSNGVSQTDGVAGMAPAWQLCPLWGRFRKGTMAPVCLDARHFSFSLCATGAFQVAILVLERRGSESE